MTLGSRLWFVLFVLVVFAAGAFAGVIVDRAWLVQRSGAGLEETGGPILGLGAGRRGGGPRPVAIEGQIARLDRQLGLSAEQRAELREILRRWNDRANTLQREARRQFIEAQAGLRAEVEAILSADQVERFRQLRGEVGGRRGAGGREDGR